VNIFNIQRAFQEKKERCWDTLYIAIDLHHTLIEGKYNKFNEGAEIYPYAKEFFAWANKRTDICLILWTSSHKEAIEDILARLNQEGIFFQYINKNPEATSNELCDFGQKFYFNVLIDDKSSFEGETDWVLVCRELERATGDKIIDWNDVSRADLKAAIEKSAKSLDIF
jgi:hypothetical protein